VETLNPYGFFISEREFDASQLYVNSYGVSSSSVSFSNLRQSESTIMVLLIVIGLLNHFAPVRANQALSVTEGFTYLFFFAAINIFTGFFVMI